jgi:hypothetical protein
MIRRRSLITGLISLIAAPAIVRAGLLMPAKVMEPALTGVFEWGAPHPVFLQYNGGDATLILRPDGKPLVGGDLAAGQMLLTIWNGNNWIALNI